MVHVRRAVVCLCFFVASLDLSAQQAVLSSTTDPGPLADSARLISFSDTVAGQQDGSLTVTFALYSDQQGTAALWTETQVMQVTGGQYTALLGSTDPNGLPSTFFAADQAHWLGVQANGTEKRYLLVSVPYAMKAAEAERFGGLLPSDYVTVAQLQSLLGSSAAGKTATAPSGSTQTTSPIQTAAATGTAPQPATDFTDNNTSEVLLVTQQGTGYAIHAISSGDAALFAENSSITGTALKVVATATTGSTIGVLGQAASPTGIAAVFDSLGGGKVLSLRSNGAEVASFDVNGNLTASGQLQAQNFVGNGFGLTNIPSTAVGATAANSPGAIVARDLNGNFSAGQIAAQNFVGNGFGLTGIPPAAVNATAANNPGAIVARDFNGDFAAGQISAQNFFGNGFGLTNVPPTAVGAQFGNFPGAIVMRDINGDFSAGQITAQNFIGNGFGLTNVSPTAVGAQFANFPGAIVMRDNTGSFSAGQITAQNFIGNGFGLTNIPPAAVGATSTNTANSVVARDAFGNFAAGQIQALNFIGAGFGLTNIPNSATTATDANTPGAIVARDANGGFSVSSVQVQQQLLSTGLTDFSAALSTAPVKTVLAANTPNSCQASKELLIKTDAPAGQQLFICNATGSGYVLVGDGTAAGVVSLSAGDSSIAVGGAAASPTVAVADGSITATKLAPGAVTSSIADGSLSPAKITGTAATLGSNTFTGTQVMPGLTVQGPAQVTGGLSTNAVNTNSITATNGSFQGTFEFINNISGTALTVTGGNSTSAAETASAFYHAIDATSTSSFGLFASSTNNIGLHADGPIGAIDAQTPHGWAIQANVTGGSGIAGVFINQGSTGEVVSGRSGPTQSEVFGVDTVGNLLAVGALMAQYQSKGTLQYGPAKLDSNTGDAVAADLNTTNGVIGIAATTTTFGPVRIAYAGVFGCLFDGAVNTGDYVGISRRVAGQCTDLGSSYPTSGQVLGRVLQTGVASTTPYSVYLFGGEERGITGAVSTVGTGAGLTGGPITSTGTISIANAGVTNAMLQNPSVTINAGAGLSGGGTIPLGSSTTFTNTGVLSFNGRTGNLFAAPGDYSFSQIAGTATPAQLPAATAYTNQSNTFTADQTVNGTLTAGVLASNTFKGNSISLSTASALPQALVSVLDIGPSTPFAALSVQSQNNQAAVLTSGAPVTLTAGTLTKTTMILDNGGNLTITGRISAPSFTGDGSALSNVTASFLGNLTPADVATVTALNAETTARQSADAILQSSITAETTARQSDVANLQSSIASESTARAAADASLASSISAETTARQSDVANLQTNINNVSAADAKLAASNTFTAGTQDFSGAGATLPVRAVPTANTPATCIAGKELLIKTDAPAGQQLFICDAGGTTWNLVGDGASGGVTAFNGRNGSVSPAANDYSFNQISGSVAAAQLPGLTGDVTSPAGSTTTTLAATGIPSGVYTKLTIDAKGRAIAGNQAAFSDLSGSATAAQLPSNVVYNDQMNVFSTSQIVNGTLSATSLSGSGAGVTNVNAASLGGLPSSSYAQINAANTFTAKQTMPIPALASASLNLPAGPTPTSPVAGDVWNTGSTIQYRDNGSNTRTLVSTMQPGGTLLLKLTASITPTSVGAQSCTEQSFTVSGIAGADMLLSVAQPSTSSPGTNIAIGGWRVSAANTVAIQFCNPSRNSSTPVAGTYTFAIWR